MAENGEDEGNENNEETPKDLRKQLSKAHKERDDLLARLQELEAKDRSRTISDLVANAGLPAKVAKLLPTDVEPTEESINSWLKEYEDVFGKVDKTDAGDGSNAESGDNVDAETKAAQQRLADATAGGTPGGKAADLLSKMQAAKTAEELTEILQSA